MNKFGICSRTLRQQPEGELNEASPVGRLFNSAAVRLIVDSLIEEEQLADMLVPEDVVAEARLRRRSLGGKPMTRRELPGFTQRETAQILGISERAVRAIEKRAVQKLRLHPELRQLWAEYYGDLEEAFVPLTAAEIEAFLGLARSPQELGLVYRVLCLVQ